MTYLTLKRPSEEHIKEIENFRQELLDRNCTFDGCAGLEEYEDISAWITLCRLTEKEETKPNPDWVEADTFLLMHEGKERILGMINFRHYLNDYLSEYGGHIGYAIRPTEQRKGYAKAMLALCLDECRKLGLNKVLLTCDSDNKASYRTIEACGGHFERMTELDGIGVARYWITIRGGTDRNQKTTHT